MIYVRINSVASTDGHSRAEQQQRSQFGQKFNRIDSPHSRTITNRRERSVRIAQDLRMKSDLPSSVSISSQGIQRSESDFVCQSHEHRAHFFLLLSNESESASCTSSTLSTPLFIQRSRKKNGTKRIFLSLIEPFSCQSLTNETLCVRAKHSLSSAFSMFIPVIYQTDSFGSFASSNMVVR